MPLDQTTPSTKGFKGPEASGPLSQRHALIVDDEKDTAELLATLLVAEGYSVMIAHSLSSARRRMAMHSPNVVLLDLHLPDGSGMDLVEDIKHIYHADVVLVTGYATMESSIQALRMGATDYLTKPINMQQLRGVLSRVSRPNTLGNDAETLLGSLEAEGHFGLLWGRTPPMRKLYEQILRVAATGITVFITGESGTGKELVARTVHDLSRRRDAPFLAVNCGAISPQLMESEIFGHEKGSFTGAERQHTGFFERANGGTLFLDELTEMPADLQVKLLRVLETGKVMRVGSTQNIEIDVRLVAATNRIPTQAVGAGRLREDLYYRLNVFPIHLPPLRDRLDDVGILATHFMDEISRREGIRKQFSPTSLHNLRSYGWPGNVRELRNIVQRAYVMSREEIIQDECIPSVDSPAPSASTMPVLTMPLGTPLAEAERLLILSTYEYLARNKERTAAVLGVSLKTLYNRLKEYATVPSRNGELNGTSVFDSKF